MCRSNLNDPVHYVGLCTGRMYKVYRDKEGRHCDVVAANEVEDFVRQLEAHTLALSAGVVHLHLGANASPDGITLNEDSLMVLAPENPKNEFPLPVAYATARELNLIRAAVAA